MADLSKRNQSSNVSQLRDPFESVPKLTARRCQQEITLHERIPSFDTTTRKNDGVEDGDASSNKLSIILSKECESDVWVKGENTTHQTKLLLTSDSETVEQSAIPAPMPFKVTNSSSTVRDSCKLESRVRHDVIVTWNRRVILTPQAKSAGFQS